MTYKAELIPQVGGCRRSFDQDIHAIEPARDGIQPLINKVSGYCAANGIGAKTTTLKVKYSNYVQITRSKTILTPFRDIQELHSVMERF